MGDMMALNNLPGVAQVAMQGCKYVAGQSYAGSAESRRARPSSTSTRAAWQPSPGSMPSPASAEIHLAGFFAWLMWLGVHVMYLIGFKNRLTTMLHWAVSFIFRGTLAAHDDETADRRPYVDGSAERHRGGPQGGSAEPGADRIGRNGRCGCLRRHWRHSG